MVPYKQGSDPTVREHPSLCLSMSATRTPVDDADDRHPNLENPACTRKRVFDILSQSLSQTGRKKKHKKYPHQYSLLNPVTLHILTGMTYSCHMYVQDAGFHGLSALSLTSQACFGLECQPLVTTMRSPKIPSCHNCESEFERDCPS